MTAIVGRQIARFARDRSNRLIAAYSLVPDEPVLDMRDFAWTAGLRGAWQAIRDEARRTFAADTSADPMLWLDGAPVTAALARCPATERALSTVPGLAAARFARLGARTHEPARRGPTKRLITCQLGLIVPRDGDARMRVGDRIVRWAEGETLVFDDSYDHESWNDCGTDRVVLTLRFDRPLRNPARWLAGIFPRPVQRPTGGTRRRAA